MDKCILFFDIDGTLVDETTHRIPESTLEALSCAQARGHLLFINTGRCRSYLPDVIQAFPFDGFCCACGAHIEYQNKILMTEFVPTEDIVFIRSLLEQYHMFGIFQGPEYCWFSQTEDTYESLKLYLDVTDKDYRGPKKSIEEDPSTMQVNKLNCFRHDDCNYNAFRQKVVSRYQVLELGRNFTEILPLPYTKASCMDFLMDYFQICRENCYVFGDSPNDLSMMTHVPHSICMGNGHDSVKQAASYVTDSIDHDGIRNAIEKLGLI